MVAQIQIPTRFIAGTTLQFTRTFPDYPPSAGWTLAYSLTKAGSQIIFSSADNGAGGHWINVPASTTESWAAGSYAYQGIVGNGTDQFQVDAGSIEIQPNFAAQTSGLDARSHAQRFLDAIEAQLEGRATQDQQRIEIQDRRLENFPMSELLKLRNFYRGEVAREDAAASGRPNAQKMRVSFTR